MSRITVQQVRTPSSAGVRTCCSICDRNRLCTPVPLYDTRILYLCAMCHIPRPAPPPCPVCGSQDGRTLCDGCKLDICLACGYPCACGDRDGARDE